MSEAPRRPQHVFIVRLWTEAAEPTTAQWRGSVEHVPSAQRLYFVSLGDLTDFIVLHTKWKREPALDQPQRRWEKIE
jgi:hypothetical protein